MVANAIKENIELIREKLSLSAKKSGRDVSDIKIMAVSKFQPIEKIIIASGYVDIIGENRVQEAEKKILEWPVERVTPWHLIGSLQRNKVRKALTLFDLIESLDSYKLAETINRIAGELGISEFPVFIEINTSGEKSKMGISTEEAEKMIEAILEKCDSISVEGLMTIAPNTDNVLQIRKAFKELRNTRDLLRKRLGLKLPELSMGMSDDFEIAIEEGSTIVRIGSTIFGARE